MQPSRRRYPSPVDRVALTALLSDWGQPAYRARQAFEAQRAGADGWSEVGTLPAALRDRLEEALPFWALRPSERVVSRDGTVKWGLRAADGVVVEAVLIAHAEGRRTVCVSSQAGCALGCDFCATGRMGAGPQPDRGRDRRPGRAGRARVRRAGRAPDQRGLHGDGRAHAEPRRGAGGLRRHQLPRGARDLGAPDRDLDRRLGAGHRRAGRAPAAGAPGRLAARGRRRHALRDDADQQPLPDRQPARRLPALLRHAPGGACSSSTSCWRTSTTRSPTPSGWRGCCATAASTST